MAVVGLNGRPTLGQVVARLDASQLGAHARGIVEDLHPICRSITGEGVRLAMERRSSARVTHPTRAPPGRSADDRHASR
jgi:hypothetical protein